MVVVIQWHEAQNAPARSSHARQGRSRAFSRLASLARKPTAQPRKRSVIAAPKPHAPNGCGTKPQNSAAK
jgi:hypothetical protein